MHSEICPVCNGTGKYCNKKCHGCDGKGWVEVSDSYTWYPYTITWYQLPEEYTCYNWYMDENGEWKQQVIKINTHFSLVDDK